MNSRRDLYPPTRIRRGNRKKERERERGGEESERERIRGVRERESMRVKGPNAALPLPPHVYTQMKKTSAAQRERERERERVNCTDAAPPTHVQTHMYTCTFTRSHAGGETAI